MKSVKPFFSVVTPSFQQGEWIEGCIESVISQGGQDFEHIIFDNCSSDSTPEVLARYPHLRVYAEKDRGQSEALNKAMGMARGEIICWLNADDRYRPGTFEILRRAFAETTTAVVFGDAEEIFFDGRPPAIRPARFHCREDFLIWWEKRTDLLQPSVFFRRSLLVHAGRLREDLHFVMDTEFWWRLSEYAAFQRIDFVFSTQMRQPSSKTVRSVHRIYEEKRKVFAPLLAMTEPAREAEFVREGRRALCRRYIGLAQTLGPVEAPAARHMLRRAFREYPGCFFSYSWWKAWLFIAGLRRPTFS